MAIRAPDGANKTFHIQSFGFLFFRYFVFFKGIGISNSRILGSSILGLRIVNPRIWDSRIKDLQS